MLYISSYISPVGKIYLASDGGSLLGLCFEGQTYFVNTVSGQTPTVKDDLPVFKQTAKWLDIYFSGKEPDFTPPLTPQGTSFRKSVWDILLKIPYGKTVTYGQIAAELAKQKGIKKMSAQAVGGAVGRNPISIIIPCHRVIGAYGNLTGYGGGIDKKIKLLNLEKAVF